MNLVIVMLWGAFAAQSQPNLNQKISLHVENMRLEYFLDTLQVVAPVRVGYGSDNIPVALPITLHADGASLYEILDEICSLTQLTYKVIGDVVVFRYPADGPGAPREVVDTAAARQRRTSRDKSVIQLMHSGYDVGETLLGVVPILIPAFTTIITTEPADLIIAREDYLSVYGATLPVVSRPKAPAGGMFVGCAVDYNRFAFKEREISEQEYVTTPNRSFGFGGYVTTAGRIHFSLALNCSEKRFALDYHYRILDPGDPFPIPDRTVVKTRYLEFPFMINYTIFCGRKYAMSLGTGFQPCFLVQSREETTFLNAQGKETADFLAGNAPAFYGGNVGVTLHRAVSRFGGVFFRSDVVYFDRAANSMAMKGPFVLYRIRAGVVCPL